MEGAVEGARAKSGGSDGTETYQLNLHIAIIFLGGVALNLVTYSWMSPYWYMMGRRAYTVTPELRVLGLTELLEGSDKISSSFVWDARPVRKSYKLSERRDRVCGLQPPAATDAEDCDLDCEDMKLMGPMKVLCDGNGYQMMPHPIPIPPAPRILAALGHNESEADLDIDLTLPWGCDERKRNVKCPTGYKMCNKKLRNRCEKGRSSWLEPKCCVDPTVIGTPLFGVTKPPTYVHVFGWAQWLQRSLGDEVQGVRKCSVRDLRCKTLTAFADNGRRCINCVTFAGLLMVAALVLALSRVKRTAISGVAGLFAVAGLLNLYAQWDYHSRTSQTLKWTMTPVDRWGRPHIHSMYDYSFDGRKIEAMPKGDMTSGEWMYYHINARVDYLTEDPRNKKGFTKLWGVYLGTVGGFVALAASVVSVEMQCTLRGFSPLAKLMGLVLVAILFLPIKIKQFIDDNLAAYPVLAVYPWQKLYPKAFTAGSWLCFPFDQIYDLGLMLPVHCIRAIWDYVSCQDICSPQEKQVLHQKGIFNDRLCSLLCSRRSYFAMMAGLGALSFTVNLTEVIKISSELVHLKHAASKSDVYPYYRCNYAAGQCAIDEPDPESLVSYVGDMALRIYATINTGSLNIETTRALVEWLGGFIAISCATGALANWTNFAVSRKFCLIGWIFMMLTPVITSSLANNRRVNWPNVNDQILNVSAEVWEEGVYFASQQNCDQALEMLEMAFDKGHVACTWVKALKLVMPKSVQEGCVWFKEVQATHREDMLANATEICKAVKQYSENGPEARRECQERVQEVAPDIIDVFQMLVGLQAGIKNKMKLMAAVMGMAPALMQGGLMIKNMVPRQTIPSILTTLPFAFTSLIWAQYQLYYQILTGKMFLVACLAMSFGPLVYYIYGRHYRVVQPMCDQQSVTLTFRIWWYAAICALIVPYSLMITYVVWVNDFAPDLVYSKTIGWLTVTETLSMIVGVLSSYAYSLQAGIDWFVDEVVSHHTSLHAPAVLTATITPEEAASLQQILGSDLDLDSINKGTYVCGGLGDPVRLEPSEEGSWNDKARIYASSLAFKDYATLDAFAGHLKGDPELPRVLARARRPWYRMLNNPPDGAFNGREVIGAAAEAEAVQAEAGASAVPSGASKAEVMDNERPPEGTGSEAAADTRPS